MLVVVIEDEAADAQGRRGGGGDGHRRHGGELVIEVVGHEECRVAEILDLLRFRDPVFAGCALRCLDAEAELARHASLSRYRVSGAGTLRESDTSAAHCRGSLSAASAGQPISEGWW